LGSNQENLTLIGTAIISGTGNTLNNVIRGNNSNNSLRGLVGNDTLFGNGGNDFLDGGSGIDSMAGGSGNDTYVVDNIADVVTESAGAGTDTILSSVSRTLGSNQENLTLIGTAIISGTGNTLNNVIRGNSGRNSLNGGAGNDSLFGGSGNDTITGGSGNDLIVGGSGSDRLTSGSTSDADIFRFDSITERTDTITDFDRINNPIILGDDRDIIQVRNTGFNPTGGAADLVNGVVPANRLVNGSTSLGTNAGFRYFEGNGNLYFDSNGGGFDFNVGALLLATLANRPTFASMAGSITVI
jgi:Ca2+-binding RTX toxin-like protein